MNKQRCLKYLHVFLLIAMVGSLWPPVPARATGNIQATYDLPSAQEPLDTSNRIFGPTNLVKKNLVSEPAAIPNLVEENPCLVVAQATYLPLVLRSSGTKSSSNSNSGPGPVQKSAGNSALKGRVLDANEAAKGNTKPLVGVTICSLETGQSTKSDQNGNFLLSGLPAGKSHVQYIGDTALPLDTYASYRSKIELAANKVTEITRPIYLMKKDPGGEVQINPNQTTTLNNTKLGVKMTIPPHTVKDDSGNDFDGMMSVSEVPVGFTPGSLPDTLEPGFVVTIQPMGLTFDQPVPVTFPNTDNLPAGIELDIWSMDHETGTFFIAGKGRVSSNGSVIETIAGGVREASWHFLLPLILDLLAPSDADGANQVPSNSGQCIASMVTTHNGSLQTSFSLPDYVSIGQNRGLDFVYNSNRAYPFQLVPIEPTVPVRAAVPPKLSVNYNITSASINQTGFISTAGLNENRDEPLRAVLPLDTSNLDTGVYNASLRLTSHYNRSAISTADNDQMVVVNEQNSSFGAGWGLAGLQRLEIQDNGNEILAIEGNGSVQHIKVSQPFVFGGFDAGRGGNGSYPEGSFHTALRTSLKKNYPGVKYAAFSEVTNDNLANVDIVVLTSVKYPDPRTTSLSISEQAALSNYVQNGKCAVLLSDNSIFGGNNTPAANESLLDPFGMDASGTIRNNRVIASVDKPQLHPLTNGRFGTVSQLVEYWPGSISSLGPFAQSLATNTLGTTLAVIEKDAISPNSGPVVIFSDFNPFDYIMYPENENLFLNTIDFCLNNIDLPPVNEFQSPDGDYSTLTKNNDGTFTRRMKNGTEYRFNSQGFQTQMVDRNGNTTRYGYDGQGRLTTITDPVGLVTTLAYSGNRLNRITDPNGRVTTFTHTGSDLTRVTFPNGTSQTFGYNGRHLMTRETNQRGQETTRQFDSYGRITQATLPDGSVRRTSASQSIGLIDPSTGIGTEANPAPVVRPNAAVSELIDGEGRMRVFSTGPINRFATVTDPTNLTTTYNRDSDGNVTQLRRPGGGVYDQAYDSKGNLTTFTDRTLNGTSRFTYEGTYNQLTSITNPYNQVTNLDYDGTGNLTRITTPLNRTATFEYNGRGQVTRLVDPLGTEATFSYNSSSNLSRVTQGRGSEQRVANLTYTDQGYLDTLTDPLNRVYDYNYDTHGRLTSESLPGGRTVSYVYDNEGNLTSLTPPGRPAHTFTYNAMDLATAYTAPAVTNGGTNQTLYAYNNAQELTQITRPDNQTLAYGYDSAGRLSSLTIPRGQFGYSHNAASGYLSSMTAPDGVNLGYTYSGDYLTRVTWSGPINGSVSYSYDRAARLSRVTIGSSYFNYTYDADSRISGVNNRLRLNYDAQSGLLNSTSLDNTSDSRSYNQFAELTGYSAATSGSPRYAVQYGRDALGRIITKTETITDVTTNYSYNYDAAGRLEEVLTNGATTEQYTYDQNGNRLLALGIGSTIYDSQDRLLQYGGTTYSYTPNGELQSKNEGGQETTYAYDVLGNLMGVTLPNGTPITYVIDGQNRRIGKRVNGTLQRGWLYQDSLNPVAELDGTGNVTAYFAYASRPNIPDYMFKNSTRYRIISDHLGSVRLVVNSSTGAIIQRLDYDAFGRVLLDTNPGFQPFGFAGGLYDPDTGLVRFGARDYDAEVGRWTTKDPIGFDGGDANLYGYVGGDPVNLVDLQGLLPVRVQTVSGSMGTIYQEPWVIQYIVGPYSWEDIRQIDGLEATVEDLAEWGVGTLISRNPLLGLGLVLFDTIPPTEIEPGDIAVFTVEVVRSETDFGVTVRHKNMEIIKPDDLGFCPISNPLKINVTD